MTIYIILLLYILAVGVLFKTKLGKSKKAKAWLLFSIFVFIYLICVLRSSTVGRDIPGYRSAYELTKHAAWNDFSYNRHFEKGYMVFMKLCAAAKLSFQGFLAITYAIIITPVFLFIKRYSKDYVLSSLIFVCYQYLNFDLSGIRQAMAMSLTLVAYIVLLEAKRFPRLLYICIVVFASFFHKSALICLVFIALSFLHSLYSYIAVMAAGTIGLLFARTQILTWTKELFEKDSMDDRADLYIGLNFVFCVVLGILFFWKAFRDEKPKLTRFHRKKVTLAPLTAERVNVRMFAICILIMLLFGSDTAARSYVYLNQVLIVALPDFLTVFNKRSRMTAGIFCGILLIALFTSEVLIGGGFDVVPYHFFWQ